MSSRSAVNPAAVLARSARIHRSAAGVGHGARALAWRSTIGLLQAAAILATAVLVLLGVLLGGRDYIASAVEPDQATAAPATSAVSAGLGVSAGLDG